MNQFVQDNKIHIINEFADNNPNMEDSRSMDNWKVTLKRGRKQMTLYFSKGYGHNGTEPTTDEVLDCVVSESYAMETDFEDWCSEFGYDADSRKAERTYNACKRNTIKLVRFLGSDLYDALINDTERM